MRWTYVVVGALLFEGLLSEDIAGAEEHKGRRALSDEGLADEGLAVCRVRVNCKLSGRINSRECAHLNAWSNIDMAECPRRVWVVLPGFFWWSREAE